LYLPARKQVDATVLTADGRPLVSYRGLVQGKPDDLATGFSVGYQPLLVKTPTHEGIDKWTPQNLVSRWYWAAGDSGAEVDKALLRGTWFKDGRYRPQVVALFDADRNGDIDHDELLLDRGEKVELIGSLLAAQGVVNPVLKAEVRAHHIHHSVALADANRDCARCHDASTEGDFELADHLPGGVLPSVLRGVSDALPDRWQTTAAGGLSLPRPAPLSRVVVTSEQKP